LFDGLGWADIVLPMESTWAFFYGMKRRDVVHVGGLLTYADVMMPY
jgi:hypothetical protein